MWRYHSSTEYIPWNFWPFKLSRENRCGVRQQTGNTYRILPLPSYYENGDPIYADDHALPV